MVDIKSIDTGEDGPKVQVSVQMSEHCHFHDRLARTWVYRPERVSLQLPDCPN